MKKRNVLYALLLVLFLLAAFPASPSKAEAEVLSAGDMTGDGITTAADAACILRGIADSSLNGESRPDLDFTQNGEIDGTDVRAALLYACGGISDWVTFGERVSSGLCDERLFDRFSYTGTQNDGTGNYKSENVSINIITNRAGTSNYHYADIYIQDLSCFVTAFSNEKYLGIGESVRKMFEATPGAIVAMNGDFYSIHVFGPVIRNGVTYEDHVTKDWDIAVLRSSGELATYEYRTLTKEELTGLDAYQTWVFGPVLLDENGHAKTEFRSHVQSANPRSVLGYYEPGHYAFLTVDGRSNESEGMTTKELSQLCEDLGFTRAFNLDGGQSSVLMVENGAVNVPFRGGRSVSDIMAIRELPEE